MFEFVDAFWVCLSAVNPERQEDRTLWMAPSCHAACFFWSAVRKILIIQKPINSSIAEIVRQNGTCCVVTVCRWDCPRH
jgi:hypothetical protein